ncbi:hypothetical protein EMCRGX_G005790 [Ephydatia muelleri]
MSATASVDGNDGVPQSQTVQSRIKHSPQLVEEATALCEKYKTAFSLFSQCHNFYNKNCITEQDKSTLADSIQEFFSYLGHACPGMKRTVKMHLLKDHVSEWVDMNNAGFGLMREQGTEAIQIHFKKLYRTYGSMANKVQRLKLCKNTT